MPGDAISEQLSSSGRSFSWSINGGLHLLIVMVESTYSNISSRKSHDEVCDDIDSEDSLADATTVFAAAMCQFHLEEFPSRISIIQKRRMAANAWTLKRLLEDSSAIRSFRALKAA